MTQFTEKGHIFVKVHLAEQSKDGAESKPALNRGVASEDITAASKPSSYNTLSGYEALKVIRDTVKVMPKHGERSGGDCRVSKQ